MLALLLITIGLAAFLLRLLFSIFSASDTRGVFWRLERLRGSPWVHYELDDCAVPARHGYPVLFHWLLAQLPRKRWVSGGYAINASLDLVVAGAVVAAAMALAGSRADGAGLALPVGAAAVFLFTPVLVPANARMMAFNGRAFGLVLFAAYAALLFAYLQGSWWALAAAGAVFGLIVLASQFTFQAAVAATAGLAIAYRSPALALLLPVSLAVGCLARPLGVREPLKYFWGLYVWQFRQRKLNTVPAVRAQWWRRAFGHLRRGRWGDLARTLYSDSPQVASLLGAPSVVLVAWLAAAEGPLVSGSLAEPLVRFCLTVTAGLAAMTVLTWFSPFSILGQAERYLEYAAAPAAVAAVWLLAERAAPATGTAGIAALAAIGACLCLLSLVFCARRSGYLLGGRSTYLSPHDAAYLKWFDTLPSGARVLPVPLTRGKSISAAARGSRPVRLLYDWLTVKGDKPLAYMGRCMVGLRYTPEGFRGILDEFDFDAALVFKDETVVWTDGRGVRDWTLLRDALDDGWETVAEDGAYALVARRDRIGSAPASRAE